MVATASLSRLGAVVYTGPMLGDVGQGRWASMVAHVDVLAT